MDYNGLLYDPMETARKSFRAPHSLVQAPDQGTRYTTDGDTSRLVVPRGESLDEKPMGSPASVINENLARTGPNELGKSVINTPTNVDDKHMQQAAHAESLEKIQSIFFPEKKSEKYLGYAMDFATPLIKGLAAGVANRGQPGGFGRGMAAGGLQGFDDVTKGLEKDETRKDAQQMKLLGSPELVHAGLSGSSEGAAQDLSNYSDTYMQHQLYGNGILRIMQDPTLSDEQKQRAISAMTARISSVTNTDSPTMLQDLTGQPGKTSTSVRTTSAPATPVRPKGTVRTYNPQTGKIE